MREKKSERSHQPSQPPPPYINRKNGWQRKKSIRDMPFATTPKLIRSFPPNPTIIVHHNLSKTIYNYLNHLLTHFSYTFGEKFAHKFWKILRTSTCNTIFFLSIANFNSQIPTTRKQEIFFPWQFGVSRMLWCAWIWERRVCWRTPPYREHFLLFEAFYEIFPQVLFLIVLNFELLPIFCCSKFYYYLLQLNFNVFNNFTNHCIFINCCCTFTAFKPFTSTMYVLVKHRRVN